MKYFALKYRCVLKEKLNKFK